MRALLLDTGMEVSTLAQGGAESVPALRERCLGLVRALDASLDAMHVPSDVRDDLVHAQCGLLDESAMHYLPAGQGHEWDARPLQVERFENHDAGERVYERLAVRMRETPPNVDLLECYSAILGLGFHGRYASPVSAESKGAEIQRAALIESLDRQIARLKSDSKHSLIQERTGVVPFGWLRHPSPLALAATVGCAAALVWLFLGHALDTQIARLLALQPR